MVLLVCLEQRWGIMSSTSSPLCSFCVCVKIINLKYWVVFSLFCSRTWRKYTTSFVAESTSIFLLYKKLQKYKILDKQNVEKIKSKSQNAFIRILPLFDKVLSYHSEDSFRASTIWGRFADKCKMESCSFNPACLVCNPQSIFQLFLELEIPQIIWYVHLESWNFARVSTTPFMPKYLNHGRRPYSNPPMARTTNHDCVCYCNTKSSDKHKGRIWKIGSFIVKRLVAGILNIPPLVWAEMSQCDIECLWRFCEQPPWVSPARARKLLKH